MLALPVALLGGVGYLAWTNFAPVPTRNQEVLEGVKPPLLSNTEIAKLLTTDILPISTADAVSINATRPVDVAQLVAARPFVLPTRTASNPSNALLCMTQAIYYEAANESDAGQRAVAQVVLNRMRNRAFPKSVCGVVYQGSERTTGCQFSFTCDGSLSRVPSPGSWARAQRHAAAALNGWVERSVGLATHYHANYVVPYWASSLDKAKTIGTHLFYVMRGVQNRRAAFNERYDASAEIVPGMKPGAELPVDAAQIDPAIDLVPTTSTVPAPLPSNIREDGRGQLAVPQSERHADAAKPATALRADDSVRRPAIDQDMGTLTPGK